MKKNGAAIIVLLIAFVLLLAGVGLLIVLQSGLLDGEKNKVKGLTYNQEGYQTFADFTSAEVFKAVPALYKEGAIVSDARDYGSDNWLISIDSTIKEDYDTTYDLNQELWRINDDNIPELSQY